MTQPGFFDATARTGTGIQFALSPASDFASSFSINPTTGVITILDSLDREQQEFYNVGHDSPSSSDSHGGYGSQGSYDMHGICHSHDSYDNDDIHDFRVSDSHNQVCGAHE